MAAGWTLHALDTQSRAMQHINVACLVSYETIKIQYIPPHLSLLSNVSCMAYHLLHKHT